MFSWENCYLHKIFLKLLTTFVSVTYFSASVRFFRFPFKLPFQQIRLKLCCFNENAKHNVIKLSTLEIDFKQSFSVF